MPRLNATEQWEHLKDSDPDRADQLLKAIAELEDCREQIKELRVWERDVIERIYELLPATKVAINGIGIVQRSRSTNRKWDHDAVFDHLIARALDHRQKIVDKDTGEITAWEKEGHAVGRIIRQCAGISYWRLEDIKEYGLDPDEYAESSSRLAIRIIQ